jgi:YegS/Rv2252/BmrU family lipid kinase
LEAILSDIENCFEKTGRGEYSVHISRFPRDAILVIRKYYEKNSNPGSTIRVYAVGGDGILFDCLNGIIGLENAELAVIPYGNGNDFMRAFGEGKNDLFRDIALQAVSPVIPTDVIFCGGNYALNTCTIGMESYTVHRSVEWNGRYQNIRDSLPSAVGKFMYGLTFTWGGIMASMNRQVVTQHYDLQIDGRDFSGPYVTINIANGPCYGGDKCAAIAAMPDDSMLDVLLFKSVNYANIVRVGTRYIYGKYRDFPDYISYHRAAKITVSSDKPMVLQLDGEIFFDANITIEVVPAAVKVVAPEGLAYQRRASL